MFLWKLKYAARSSKSRKRRQSDDGIHSVDELKKVLQRERARADRSGMEFCLVAFKPAEDETSQTVLKHLAAFLQKRVRDTDEVGWMGPQNIGVVLPYTPAWGAWRLADDVCDALPEDLPRPDCEVYLHPSQKPPRDSDGDGMPRPKAKEEKEPAVPRAAHGMEVMFIQGMPLWKRSMDVLVAGSAILLLWPFLLLIAATVKLMSRGPVFFKQKRAGLGGRVFEIYKFRTMSVNAEVEQHQLRSANEQDGPAFKMKNDPRVTRIGSFLRKSSLDELPQLWNVLLGNMTLVGPRPLPCHESDACDTWQRQRLDVTPGITCIWQTKGRSRVTFDNWMRMDIKYIHSRSFLQDLKLLVQTALAVVTCKGAR